MVFLPRKKPGERGRSGNDSRLFAWAVVWVGYIGLTWRDLPLKFGSWNGAELRFARWSDKQVQHKVLAALRQDADFQKV